MIHCLRVNHKTVKLYSLKSYEIEELFQNPPRLLKKTSLNLINLGFKLKIKVFLKESSDFLIKYGITISKKVGKAVKRNLLKRKLREILISNIKKIKKFPNCNSYLFLLILKPLRNRLN